MDPCGQPIYYRIGSINPNFNISQSQLKNDLTTAANIWNKAEGKQLLSYNPQGGLVINMVYDERQSAQAQVSQTESQVQAQQQLLQPSEQKYQAMVVDFQQRLAAFNAEVDSWNRRGGASPDVYQKLMQEQQDLKNEVSQINQMGHQLNQSVDAYNSAVGNLQQATGNFNSIIQERPEEGLYNPASDEIDIYIHSGQNEFIHTLAHEMGHALGLGHTFSPADIMYPYTTSSVSASENDTEDIRNHCEKIDFQRAVSTKMQQTVDNLNFGNILQTILNKIDDRQFITSQPQKELTPTTGKLPADQAAKYLPSPATTIFGVFLIFNK